MEPPIFFRSYSGERLCRKCFINSIEGQVRETISKYRMLRPDDTIAVAVSGGKDSVSLLHILTRIERDFPGARVVAITINEGISGYRSEAVKIARKNCAKLDVEQIVLSFKELYGYELDDIVRITRKRTRLTPCSYCGVLRRKALNTAAKEAGASKLATAHNLDDEVQTIFLNIVHGDVMRIARVEPAIEEAVPKFVQRVKPLCEVPENEIALYAYLNEVEFQTTPCPYMYTSMRNTLRSTLNRLEAKYPGVKFTVFRAIEKIRPTLKMATVNVRLRNCAICNEPTVGKICKPCETLQKLELLR
jgi:uncharacterized protein (TIGR00269 family)